MAITLNDLLPDPSSPSSFFYTGGAGAPQTAAAPLSPEALKRRHEIIRTMMAQRSKFANPLAQGISDFGQAIGDVGQMRRFDAQEAASEKAVQEAANPSITPPVGPTGVGTPGAASMSSYPALASAADLNGAFDPANNMPWMRSSFNEASDSGADAGDQSAAAGETGGPVPAPYQVASLGAVPPPAEGPAATGTVPAELPPNPPTPTDIRPMPQVAQLVNVPPPTTKPTPEPAPEYLKTPQAQLKLYQEPVPPRKPNFITRWEDEGYKMMRGPFGTDPRVQAKARQLIEFGSGQRQADYDREVEIYKRDKTQWDAQQTYTREAGAKDVETAAKARELQQKIAEREHFGDISPAQAFEIIRDSHKEVRPLIAAQAAIQNAQRVIDQAYTGAGAKYKLDAARALQALGIRRDSAISPTQQFQAYVASTIGGLRSQVAGPGSQSEKELAKLETATGDNITLEPTALKAILGSIEQANLISAAEHQQKLLTYSGTDPNRTRQAYGNFGLPIWRMLPAAKIQQFTKLYREEGPKVFREIDDDYSTPGLGQKLYDLYIKPGG